MKKIFTYRMIIYNGTVTMQHVTPMFATRELAEESREKSIVENYDFSVPGLRLNIGEVEEVNLYESKDEVPIFNQKED